MRYPENGSWSVQQRDLTVGQKIKFADADERRYWWTVRAVSPHYAALTRHRPFHPTGAVLYTVIDWRNGVRGPCDLVGQGWGDGTYTEEQCTEMLAQFELPEWDQFNHDPDQVYHHRLQVSQRNWVRVDLLDTAVAVR